MTNEQSDFGKFEPKDITILKLEATIRELENRIVDLEENRICVRDDDSGIPVVIYERDKEDGVYYEYISPTDICLGFNTVRYLSLKLIGIKGILNDGGV
jgi:hypothetical protein